MILFRTFISNTMKKLILFLSLLSQIIITSNSQVLDITNFGAIPNDGLNDLPAVISAMNTANDGDTIYIPEGTFLIGGTIEPQENISFVGEDALLSILKYQNNSSTEIDFFSINDLENITLANFTIDANHSNEVRNAIHQYTNSFGDITYNNLIIKNIQHDEGNGMHLVQDATAPSTAIKNCTFTSIRGHFSTAILLYTGNFIVKNNTVNTIGGNGLNGTNVSGKLLSNTISDVGNDFQTADESGFMSIEFHPDDTDPGPYNFEVDNNTIDSWMSIVGANNVAIRNNTIAGNGWLELGITNGIIDNNTIDNSSASIPWRALCGMDIQSPSNHLLIENNHINYARMSGISINGHAGNWPEQYIEKIYFKKNLIENTQNEFDSTSTASGTGISIIAYGSKIDFDENTIRNNTADGVGIARFNAAPYLPDELTFINNTISNNNGAALWDGDFIYQGQNLYSNNNTIANNQTNNVFNTTGYDDNQKPSIALATPIENDGQYSFPYTFDDDGFIAEILWDFGEGLPSTSLNPTHVYEQPGDYVVSVIVWDNGGRATYGTTTVHLANGNQYCGPYTNSSPINWLGIANSTIDGLEITNAAIDGINLMNCSNITIKNCKITNTNGNGINIENCNNITIRNCFMENIATGVYAQNSQNIDISNISVKNVQGPIPRGQMVQFNNVSGTGNKINYNVCENVLGQSNPEDAINIYESHGTIDHPILIIGNQIRGGGPSSSGGGIMTGDEGGAHIIVENNTLVNPGQYGIAIAGGADIHLLYNKVFAQQQPFSNVGIYVWNQSANNCSNNEVLGNQVNWINNNGIENPDWDGENCGTIIGYNNNEWYANIDESILPEQLFECETPIELNLKVFLEGAYNSNTGLMNDHLRQENKLPYEEPYKSLGFTYYGLEEKIDSTLLNISGLEAIVDWVLIELRDPENPSTIVATQPALIQRNGEIISFNGSSHLFFYGLFYPEIIVAIRHHNHLGIRSEISYPTNTLIDLDFSSLQTNIHGFQPTNLVDNKKMMISGDANLDGQINAVDKNDYWRTQNGASYNYFNSNADFNLDGAVNPVDKNGYWRINNSRIEQLE